MIDSPLVLGSRTLYTLDRTPAHSRLLQFRSPRESAGFRVSGASSSFYIAYLDEFGHIGPFVSRSHARHNTSPVFGLGGFLLPVDRVRPFASYFYQLKCNLLENVLKYRELRRATDRLLNRIEKDEGMVFYVGMQKTHSPEEHDPKALYRAVLGESIKRLDDFCGCRDGLFMVVLDELQDRKFREEIVSEACCEMFGDARRIRMIEPPIQAESHLFQTLQCADWICGLVGRAGCHLVAPISGIRHSRADAAAEGGVTRH